MAATVFEISKTWFLCTSKPLFRTSNSISYFWDSHMYMRSKYSLQICFNWSKIIDILDMFLKLYRRFYHWWLQNDDGLSKAGWKITSSNRILIPLSRSHLSPSSLKTFAWYSLHIATRSSGSKKDSHWIQFNYNNGKKSWHLVRK